MLELLAYLRANGFKTFIVSGGGIEFMRAFAEKVYGIPPEQVIGSSGKLKFEMRDGKPVLVEAARDRLHRRQGGQADRHPEAHRPPAHRRVRQLRRRPADAAVDRGRHRGALLSSTSTTPTPSASGPTTGSPRIGRLDKGLDEAKAKGWTVVNMKDDWKTIFSPEKK